MNIDIKKLKIAVMVPEEYVAQVREAMCNAGCGVIGNYTHCTMATSITGTFVATDEAHPFVGQNGVLESYQETKLEAICDAEKAKAVLAAIRSVHPYEEPGIDIYPLIDESDL